MTSSELTTARTSRSWFSWSSININRFVNLENVWPEMANWKLDRSVFIILSSSGEASGARARPCRGACTTGVDSGDGAEEPVELAEKMISSSVRTRSARP